MKRKFEEVKSLGPATAEEWVKGLEGDGKEKLSDAARWEQWELTGGLRSLKPASYLPHEQDSPQTMGLNTADAGHNKDPAHVSNGRPPNSLRSAKTESNVYGKPLNRISDKTTMRRGGNLGFLDESFPVPCVFVPSA